MKKMISICVTLAMVFTLFTFTASAATNPGDDPKGKITIDARFVLPDSYRNEKQYPYGYGFGFFTMTTWANASAELYKVTDQGDEFIDSYSSKERYTFENLEDGQYKIKFPFLSTGNYFLISSVMNGTSELSNLLTSDESIVEISGGASADCRILVEYKAFDFKTITEVGKFKDGGQEKDYFPVTAEDGSRNWAFANKNTSSKWKTCNTHSGIYYGDSADLYNGMNALEIPKLSDAEKAKGYNFVGWRLVGDESGEIYNDSEARSMKIRQDTTFKAVWEYPNHTVQFRTSKTQGKIQPATNDAGTTYSYKVDYNNQKIGELSEPTLIPEVIPEEGYEFVGWYVDLTMDTLTEDEIKALTVDKDIVLYAKYRPLGGKADENKSSENNTTGTKDTTQTTTSAAEPAGDAKDTSAKAETTAEKTSESSDTKASPETGNKEDTKTESTDEKSKPESKATVKSSGAVVKTSVSTSGAKRYSDVSTGDESDFAMMWALSVASLAALAALAGVRRRKTGR